jgi:hypothetical protein
MSFMMSKSFTASSTMVSFSITCEHDYVLLPSFQKGVLQDYVRKVLCRVVRSRIKACRAGNADIAEFGAKHLSPSSCGAANVMRNVITLAFYLCFTAVSPSLYSLGKQSPPDVHLILLTS